MLMLLLDYKPEIASMSPSSAHPQVPESSALHYALQGMIEQLQQATISTAPKQLDQWLLILEQSLQFSNLWKSNRVALIEVETWLDSTGRLIDKVQLLNRGIEYSRLYNDFATLARLQILLGRELANQGDIQAASKLLESGGNYFRLIHTPYAPAANAMAYLANNSGNWDLAFRFANQALAILSPEEWLERGHSYRNLGVAANGLGHLRDALTYFQQGLHFWEKSGNIRMKALALVNLGTAFRSLEQYQDAKDLYEQAIHIFMDANDSLNGAIAQANLGNIYLKSDAWRDAIQQYRMAEKILRLSNHRFRLGRLYNNWGMALAGEGKHVQAIKYYQQSIAICTELEMWQARANDLANMGKSYLLLEAYQDAITTFNAALEDLNQSSPNEKLYDQIQQSIKEAQNKQKKKKSV
jgi:tetratricopeptide (TPR) repeat protein